MRISDWSSDVCSSDLLDPGRPADTRNGNDDHAGGTPRLCHAVVPVRDHSAGDLCAGAEEPMAETADFVSRQGTSGLNVRIRPSGIVPVGSVRVIRLRPLPRPCGACPPRLSPAGKRPCRSEEHTSELTSLMRNSYAVLCLK